MTDTVCHVTPAEAALVSFAGVMSTWPVPSGKGILGSGGTNGTHHLHKTRLGLRLQSPSSVGASQFWNGSSVIPSTSLVIFRKSQATVKMAIASLLSLSPQKQTQDLRCWWEPYSGLCRAAQQAGDGRPTGRRGQASAGPLAESYMETPSHRPFLLRVEGAGAFTPCLSGTGEGLPGLQLSSTCE